MDLDKESAERRVRALHVVNSTNEAQIKQSVLGTLHATLDHESRGRRPCESASEIVDNVLYVLIELKCQLLVEVVLSSPEQFSYLIEDSSHCL